MFNELHACVSKDRILFLFLFWGGGGGYIILKGIGRDDKREICYFVMVINYEIYILLSLMLIISMLYYYSFFFSLLSYIC